MSNKFSFVSEMRVNCIARYVHLEDRKGDGKMNSRWSYRGRTWGWRSMELLRILSNGRVFY